MEKFPQNLKNLVKNLPALVIFHRSEGGGFWVESPDLPGCFSSGDMLGDASENFKEAVLEYFDLPKRYKRFLVYGFQEVPEPKKQIREATLIPIGPDKIPLKV